MTTAHWERVILDAAPPVGALSGLALADLDHDGHVELVTGGVGALLWYRPDTFERGVIAEGRFVVGVALEDVDGDGKLEAVASYQDPSTSVWQVHWYKPGADLHQPWVRHVIDPASNGNGHDIIFCDVDGDGQREMLANVAYCELPGIFLYKRGADATQPWPRHTVCLNVFSEGLRAADLDGDGRVEIVHGPDWFTPPADGPFAGPWERRTFAPSFREMSRTALVDVTGNGRLDVVICESEYVDGRLSWCENRLGQDRDRPWVEHELERNLVFAHSLDARRDPDGQVHVFVAEMAAGGWDQPYNWDARLIEHTTRDDGHTWSRQLLDKGAGTHQAVMYDLDGDGLLEVVGKEWGKAHQLPRVQLWKQRPEPSPLLFWRHSFLDRDKPAAGTDILAADVDGDGFDDVVCGRWWYRNPGARRSTAGPWERRSIPGIGQVLCACDLDADGRLELLGTLPNPAHPRGFSSDFCWARPIDPPQDRWELHPIGTGHGDWPHGGIVAPVLPGGRLAFVACYHSANRGEPHYPELFEVPPDPTAQPWPRRVLAEIVYGEEIVAYDLDADGKLDLVAGNHWLQTLGDGTFRAHTRADVGKLARCRVADVNGDGRPDIVYAVEAVDWKTTKTASFAPIGWLENPGDPRQVPWVSHVIDKMRSPHSLDVADLDGDGNVELIVGEHDPFRPYRSRSRLAIYKKAEPRGRAWVQYVIDDRFEHHDGTKLFRVAPGRIGIISHGWQDSRYVHLWELSTPDHG